jgi:DNA-binding response OmpR family regulator
MSQAIALSMFGKVLIVDDESSLRRVLRVSLTALGFEVDDVDTGEQALAADLDSQLLRLIAELAAGWRKIIGGNIQ